VRNWFQAFAFKCNLYRYNEDGISMDELMSYESQGFMADFMRMPGFGGAVQVVNAVDP
jgi:hypothetical protein